MISDRADQHLFSLHPAKCADLTWEPYASVTTLVEYMSTSKAYEQKVEMHVQKQSSATDVESERVFKPDRFDVQTKLDTDSQPEQEAVDLPT